MNPAVEKLLTGVTNPLSIQALLAACKGKDPIEVENVPAELLPAVFILAMVAREFGERRVTDFALLRKRTQEESESRLEVLDQLLAGASLGERAPVYPQCGPNEVQLQYLPIGARFYSETKFPADHPWHNVNTGRRIGTVVDKTSCRVTVVWEGAKRETRFTSKDGEEVSFTADGNLRTSCALDAPVTPIYTRLEPREAEWMMNAYKEVTGVFRVA